MMSKDFSLAAEQYQNNNSGVTSETFKVRTALFRVVPWFEIFDLKAARHKPFESWLCLRLPA